MIAAGYEDGNDDCNEVNVTCSVRISVDLRSMGRYYRLIEFADTPSELYGPTWYLT